MCILLTSFGSLSWPLRPPVSEVRHNLNFGIDDSNLIWYHVCLGCFGHSFCVGGKKINETNLPLLVLSASQQVIRDKYRTHLGKFEGQLCESSRSWVPNKLTLRITDALLLGNDLKADFENRNYPLKWHPCPMMTTGMSAGSLETGVTEKLILATIVLLKTPRTFRGRRRRDVPIVAARFKFGATASASL